MSRIVCQRCKRPEAVCYCHLLAPVANRRPVNILQHRLELAHPLNTARIAALGLDNCRLDICTDDTGDEDLRALYPGPEPVLIYPAPDAGTLAEVALAPETPLLFIDASWRKSRRLYLGSPWLRQLRCARLDPPELSRYRIRREPRKDYLSTLEAIVLALSQTGETESGRLLEVMDWMIGRQLAHIESARGRGN